MLGGGLHIDYTIGGGLFLTYRDQTASTTCLQDVLYADDLALVAETRKELQHMLEVLVALLNAPHARKVQGVRLCPHVKCASFGCIWRRMVVKGTNQSLYTVI